MKIAIARILLAGTAVLSTLFLPPVALDAAPAPAFAPYYEQAHTTQSASGFHATQDELLRPARPAVAKRTVAVHAFVVRAEATFVIPPAPSSARMDASAESAYLGWAPMGAGVRAPPVA